MPNTAVICGKQTYRKTASLAVFVQINEVGVSESESLTFMPKSKAGFVGISTTAYSNAYLSKIWQERSQLQEYERRGLGQFIYSTMCAHVESVLAELIENRLRAIRIMVPWQQLPPVTGTDHGKHTTDDLAPVSASILKMADSMSAQVRNAPLSKLSELYSQVFQDEMSAVLGPELNQDMKALGSVRNLFTHGRNLYYELEQDETGQFTATLDSNPVQAAALRLKAAGLVKNLDVTGSNHDELTAALFADEALIYFRNAAEQIEQRLCGSNIFPPEQGFRSLPPLPKLNP